MEYVIVRFHQDRAVLVDEQANGRTNSNIRVGSGRHTFSLDGHKDYTPTSFTCVITGTSILEPREIVFDLTACGGSDD